METLQWLFTSTLKTEQWLNWSEVILVHGEQIWHQKPTSRATPFPFFGNEVDPRSSILERPITIINLLVRDLESGSYLQPLNLSQS